MEALYSCIKVINYTKEEKRSKELYNDLRVRSDEIGKDDEIA
jgi:hypothetical protein